MTRIRTPFLFAFSHHGNTGRNNGRYAAGATVAPGIPGLSTPRPDDFDSFRDGKLAAQAKLPINPVLTKVKTDVAGVELNMFALDSLGPQAHRYVAKPIREDKFPTLIQLQYAPSDASGNIRRNDQVVDNTDRRKSHFLNMYRRDSRALDYLLTRPDWDGRTIVLTGGSMGGQQSLVLAGLRPGKITASLVGVPAGADTNGELQHAITICRCALLHHRRLGLLPARSGALL